MPKITVNDTTLYYEDTGPPGEPIVFSHGLLWNTTLFAPQVEALKHRYRCISYDHRGQGRSADDAREVIDMDLLTDDVVALIKALDLGPVHFCGLSMGGFVGMRLAARHPQLVRSLILCETSAGPEPAENAPRYRRLNFVARWLGPRVVIPAVMPILFGKTALTDPKREWQRREWKKQLNKNRRSVWRAVNGVILRQPVVDELAHIEAPTLVIVGAEDVATVTAKAQQIAGEIEYSKLVILANAGHSATVEEPAAVNDQIERFLKDVKEDGGDWRGPRPPLASGPEVDARLAPYLDVLAPLQAEAVQCSPADWTHGTLTVGCRSLYVTYKIRNEEQPGTAQVSPALRQLCEELFVRMAKGGDAWRHVVVTWRRQGDALAFETAVRWPAKSAQA